MSQKKIPWWLPQVGTQEDKDFVMKVIEANFPNQGEVSINLENKLAELLGVKHVTITTSGTVAIFMALKGYGIGHGDEVIVPNVTYIATLNAAHLTGATPVLVDCDPQTLQISLEGIEKAITKNTKAIVPVHVSGRAADMMGILEIAKKHNLIVVEDAAEAFMSKSKGKYLGTIGNAGAFSLSPNKTITSGQGGFVATNDDVLHKRLWELKNQGLAGRLSGGDDIHPTVGYNFKFTDIQAALALAQLNQLTTRLERMKKNHELYKTHLKAVKEISVFECDTTQDEVPQWTDVLCEKRDELDAYLRTKNIDCRRFWFPNHRQDPYKQADELFPESSRLIPQALWLPSSFTLTDEDVITVCDEIKTFYSA